MSTITQPGCAPSNSLPALQTSPADLIVNIHTPTSRPNACGSAANDPAGLAGATILIWAVDGLKYLSVQNPRPRSRRPKTFLGFSYRAPCYLLNVLEQA